MSSVCHILTFCNKQLLPPQLGEFACFVVGPIEILLRKYDEPRSSFPLFVTILERKEPSVRFILSTYPTQRQKHLTDL